MNADADNDDHRTPKDLFKNLDKMFGPFELDAAANDENALCKKYYTKENSGLTNSWDVARVWINPPYSNLRKWVEKGLLELSKGNCEKIVMLLPVDTSAIVWGRYVYDLAAEIYFINKRIKFHGPNELEGTSSPRANAVVVFNKNYNNKSNYRPFQYMTSKGVILFPQKSLTEFLYK
jgi:phage N-6-adenine-methyltransferase